MLELSGSRLQDVHYFEVLAAWRLCVTAYRAGRMLQRLGVLAEGDEPLKPENPNRILLDQLVAQACRCSTCLP
ncbi:hypothetical protein GCM10010170_052320 [Dactylosporangium salmoneum]|uniref:Uncharacterized protein n=1 Tax=Dactylosporangium salmoneum TaxID=53361 RepID=A0ABP5TQU2_9ACTN